MTVAEIQSRDDLPEELSGLFGSQSALLHQVVKQLSSWHVLQHQVPVGIRGFNSVTTVWFKTFISKQQEEKRKKYIKKNNKSKLRHLTVRYNQFMTSDS